MKQPESLDWLMTIALTLGFMLMLLTVTLPLICESLNRIVHILTDHFKEKP